MACYIHELQEENKRLNKKLKEFSNRFYCIGHPLNDNTLKFNTEQLVYLARFADEIKEAQSEEVK
jgi:hypothetical protein